MQPNRGRNPVNFLEYLHKQILDCRVDKVTYIEGKKNLMEDALSRRTVYYTDVEIEQTMKDLGIDHLSTFHEEMDTELSF